MRFFSSRLANFIPLLSFASIAFLNLFAEKLGSSYYLVTGIWLFVLLLLNLGLIYTRYKEGKISKVRIGLSAAIILLAVGIWAYYVFVSSPKNSTF